MRRLRRNPSPAARRTGIPDSRRLRLCVFAALMALGFLVLVIALFRVQVRSGDEHRERISRQSVRRIRIAARRGRIFSADLVVLADNEPELDLVFYPGEMRFPRFGQTVQYMMEAARQIARAIGREMPITEEKIRRHLNVRPGLPLKVFDRLDERETARALEEARLLRGVDVQSGSCRIYPQGELASNLIGFARPENPDRAEDRSRFFYYLPDLVGRAGVEKAFDRVTTESGVPLGLRGEPGYSLVEVDRLGYIHRDIIRKILPNHGHNVVLTLDSRAQRIAELLLRETYRSGAMVVLDAETGDILAAATAPGYDLGLFSPVLSQEDYRILREDPRRPLFDRARRGTYTPGSILKPLIALALLENGVDPAEKVLCDGHSQIGDADIRCAAYRRGGHGEVDLASALRWSCNCYFIRQAQKIGAEALRNTLRAAGIGEASGVEIGDAAGIFPADAAKRRIFGAPWNAYDTALLSIGQGIVTLTPLQAALFCAALATDGVIRKPHLIRQVIDSGGNLLYERSPEKRRRIAGDEALARVRQGMFEVVNCDDGSGHRARVEGLSVYGKTGSAEIGSRANRIVNTWFIAFASHGGRTIALAIVTEDGISGGRDCAPIAAEFLRRYLLADGAPRR